MKIVTIIFSNYFYGNVYKWYIQYVHECYRKCNIVKMKLVDCFLLRIMYYCLSFIEFVVKFLIDIEDRALKLVSVTVMLHLETKINILLTYVYCVYVRA